MLSTTGLQYLRGALAGTVAEGGIIFFGVVNLWLLARLLSKEDFGTYVLVFAIVGILGLLGSGGLDRLLLYRVSGWSSTAGNMVGGSYASFALLGAVLFSAALGISITLSTPLVVTMTGSSDVVLWIAVGSLSLPIQAVSTILSAWLVANHRVPEVRLLMLVKPITFTSLLLLSWTVIGTRYGVAGSYLLSAMLTAAVWLLRAGVGNLERPEWPTNSDIGYAAKLMLTRLTQTSIERVDLLMIGLLAAATATAEYAVASRLALLAGLGNRLLSPIYTPRMRSSIANTRRQELKQEYAQNRLLEFTLGLLGLCLLILVGPFLLKSFGDFTASWGVLLVLGTTHVVRSAYGPNGQYLNMAGYGSATLVTTVALLVGGIGLNWLLIPLWGALGAAIATLTSIVLINSVISFLISRWDRFGTIDPSTFIAAATLAVLLPLTLIGRVSPWASAALILAQVIWLVGAQREVWLPLLSSSPNSAVARVPFFKKDQK